MDAIETTGLTKRYGRGGPPIHRPGRKQAPEAPPALDDLAVSVREGEVFGFLGPNGAGKSTMIRLLLGYLHPTAGRATVLGFDSVRQSVQIRRRVGYLPGGIALYDSLSGERLLDYLGGLTLRSGRIVAVEDVAALLKRRKRNVEMRLAGPAPKLAGVKGVSGIHQSDGRLTLSLEGDVAPFLAAIAGAWITDLTIEPAHLEEAFLEYYADDDARERRGLAGATVMPLREEPAQPQRAQPKP